MLDEKKLKQVETKIKNYIQDGIIKKSNAKFVDFFMNNSIDSVDCANLLFEETKKGNLNGYLWVINSSYYSMFYIVRALLEKNKIKIDMGQGVHAIVFDCFVYYFYLTGKIEKKLIEDFAEAEEEAAELLGKEEAKKIVEDYYLEKGKRAEFTYEIGKIAVEQKAKTSLERAKKFNEVIRKLILK